jgi:hypothetical protein
MSCEVTTMKSQSHKIPERHLLRGQSARMSDTLDQLFAYHTVSPTTAARSYASPFAKP